MSWSHIQQGNKMLSISRHWVFHDIINVPVSHSWKPYIARYSMKVKWKSNKCVYISFFCRGLLNRWQWAHAHFSSGSPNVFYSAFIRVLVITSWLVRERKGQRQSNFYKAILMRYPQNFGTWVKFDIPSVHNVSVVRVKISGCLWGSIGARACASADRYTWQRVRSDKSLSTRPRGTSDSKSIVNGKFWWKVCGTCCIRNSPEIPPDYEFSVEVSFFPSLVSTGFFVTE